MTCRVHRTRRSLHVALVALIAAAVLVVTPGQARAHDSCAIAQPAAVGLVGSILSTFNVFSSVLDTETVECEDKYADVDVKLARDWATSSSDTAAPCVDGKAADMFDCRNIDMLAHVSHEELGTSFVNDIWGWTDPPTGKDYALVGSSDGTVFVDISDARYPQVLGILPTASTDGGSAWRDIKVYNNHAFVVSEHTNHGVQVFDLTRLRDWDGTYTTYDADAHYTGHGSAHNIAINTDTGFAYSVGAGPFSSLGLPNTVVVDDGPAAGEYLANGASFGPLPPQSGIAGAFAIGTSADGSTLGCDPLTGFPAGAIAIVDRGGCTFVTKALNAQDAGATALVVANTSDETINMGGSSDEVEIPAVMVTQSDGATIKAGLPASGMVKANDPPPPCGTGLHMIDIRDPKAPALAGCFDDHGYIHDTQCVVYEGPDTEHHGREICFNSNGIEYALAGQNYVSIVDVTDKAAPVELARVPYEGSGYSHQGWLAHDQSYYLHDDEGDEILAGVNTTTRVWNVSDLDNPVLEDVFVNDTTSIDHNLYVEGPYAYQSNYTTGLRVLDIRGLGERGPEEVAYFDVYPDNDNASFEGGTWSNYPYFRQKDVVAVSSIDRGLFILQPQLQLGRPGS